jgi:A/G-specific adenine glycosylase
VAAGGGGGALGFRDDGEGAPLDIGALRARLLAWYESDARELPWRVREGTPDPYAVWVSEVMLQQTRVEVVAPYYARWMERLPTLAALAAATEDEVLKLWEGLGYYTRARNLHRAARRAVEVHGGVPGDPEAFGALPGVGAYTRGAVASIAFARREPAVDGNARRVLSRWLDAPAPGERRLAALASALVAEGPPGELNQALMDLGSGVCRPRGPACGRCPVEALCGARRSGRQEEVPAPRRRTPPRPEVTGLAVALHDGRVLLVRLSATGRLGGTWALPHSPCEPGETPAAAALRAARPWLPAIRAQEVLPPVEHTFTHVRAIYHPVLVVVEGEGGIDEPPLGEGGTPAGSGPFMPRGAGGELHAVWADAARVDALPLSTAMRKVLRAVAEEVAAPRATRVR